MYKISKISVIILSLGAISLLGMLFLPIWDIFLTAPQYPEGLSMQIWHNNITGDVKIISALNHYIGMRTIEVSMFPEFAYLGKVIVGVSVTCLVLALIGRWWSALTYYLLLAVCDSLALYDFWKWGYDYGHNLNPDAAIVVPGMAYQPPVIGYKKLLNFEALSMPDWGGWILMVLSLVSFLVVVLEWWKHRKIKKGTRTSIPQVATVATGLIIMLCTFSSCSTDPKALEYGVDDCDFCKMTLMDTHFGAEVVTNKGKIYVFDDSNCLVNYLNSGKVPEKDIAGIYVSDYAYKGQLIEAGKVLSF